MSEVQNKVGGAFTPPFGNADAPKAGGVVTKKSVTKEAVKSSAKVKRDIKVVAKAKGWFDTERREVGDRFMVSEEEFSDNWMEKI